MTNDERAPRSGADDTVKDRIRRLPSLTAELGGEDELRRDELVARAEERGLARPDAEQAYDLAVQENLKPAWGLAVVLEGLSVQPLDGSRPDVSTSEPNEPEWVDAPPDPEHAERERRLRRIFRRVRSRFDEGPDAGAAIEALCRDPDLEVRDY